MAARGRNPSLPSSRQNAAHDASADVGQPKVASGVTKNQLRVVEPEQMQDRGVEVVDVNLVCNDLDPKIIRATIDDPAFDAATRHPGGEGGGMMLATLVVGFGNKRS